MGNPTRVGIVGLGNVGRQVAMLLDHGKVDGVYLYAVSSRRVEFANKFCNGLVAAPKVLPLPQLCSDVDIVVEATTSEAFPSVARCALREGRSLIMVSTAGIRFWPEFVDLASRGTGRVRVASGALPGLDLIRSAALGTIYSVRLRSTVLPSSFSGEVEPHQEKTGMSEAWRVFHGSAMSAAEKFPRHFNVALSLALAGVPPETIEVELWVNPSLPGPTVEVDLNADSVALSLMSRNLPSSDNPRTSRIIAPTVVAALKSIVLPFQSGS